MSYREIHPWFKATFEDYDCPAEMQDAFWNYFAYGWNPGSLGLAILENNFLSAACRAHPALQMVHLKHMALWLINTAPYGSYGSPEAVRDWVTLTDEQRRDIMIQCRLRPSLIDILKGEPA